MYYYTTIDRSIVICSSECVSLQRYISVSVARDVTFHENVSEMVADVEDGSKLLVGGELYSLEGYVIAGS